MRPNSITLAALTNDANGICVDQTTGGAADLTLDGALVSGGVATAAAAQKVSVEGTGNNSGITFTIAGANADGVTISEVLTGANNGTATTTAYFVTVTSIAASAAVTGNVEIGWLSANGAVTKSFVTDWTQSPYNQSLFVKSGTLTYTVQHTEDDPEGTYTSSFSENAEWRSTTDLTALTASNEGNIAFPVRAVRGQITAYTSGTLRLTSIQGG